MAECQEMGGEVSGEHGIGITKISFLGKSKMDALRAFKERVDPRDVMNPAKLVHRELPVRPFTFSFNRLINDIHASGLPDKEKLISLLSTVQVCTRCGKCKQVCSMCYPERSMQYHPRNKNMVLGMLLEAVYYSQVNKGAIDDNLLRWLRDLVEHCTACGRCLANCPVKIPSGEVALTLRSLLEHENAGGHPIKKRALEWLVHDVSSRVPKAAKMASLGQKVQNKLLGVVPSVWKKRMQSPIFAVPGGTEQSYALVGKILEDISAKASDGKPCCAYMGTDGAGHFVKMVHNGIEYADMQLIAESYLLLKRLGNFSNDELADIFSRYNEGELKSYLISITSKVLAEKNPYAPGSLVDDIKDSAGQKGTGKWTAISGFNLGVDLSLIDSACNCRFSSANPEVRASREDAFVKPISVNIDKEELIDIVEKCLYLGKIAAYAQGFALYKAGSDAYHWNLRLGKIA